MSTGWELVKQKDGLWYSVERRMTPNAEQELRAWIRLNVPNTYWGHFNIRQVSEDDAFLSASPSPDGSKGDDMATSRDEAKRDGALMGRALSSLMQTKNPDQAAVFTVARRFAVFAGYRDVEDALSYIEGFVADFQEGATPKQLTAE